MSRRRVLGETRSPAYSFRTAYLESVEGPPHMALGFTLTLVDLRVEVIYDEKATAADHIRAAHAVIEALRANPGFGVLVDSRAPGAVLSSEQEREIAATVAAVAPIFHGGIARVTQPGVHYGMARVQQAVAEARGIPIMAFTDPDEAVRWLAQRPRFEPPH